MTSNTSTSILHSLATGTKLYIPESTSHKTPLATHQVLGDPFFVQEIDARLHCQTGERRIQEPHQPSFSNQEDNLIVADRHRSPSPEYDTTQALLISNCTKTNTSSPTQITETVSIPHHHTLFNTDHLLVLPHSRFPPSRTPRTLNHSPKNTDCINEHVTSLFQALNIPTAQFLYS